MVSLQRDLHRAEVGPLVHDVKLQGEGGAVQGVLRAPAVILTQISNMCYLLVLQKVPSEGS